FGSAREFTRRDGGPHARGGARCSWPWRESRRPGDAPCNTPLRVSRICPRAADCFDDAMTVTNAGRPPLADGLRISIITHPDPVRLIHEAAADFIEGYGGVSAVLAEKRRREETLKALFTDGTAPPAEIVIAVSDSTGHSLYGAAIVEAFV